MIAPPLFIATKLEAFNGRGDGDYQGSRDIEDIISVLDGREEIINEVAAAQDDVRQFIVNQFSLLLSDDEFIYSISWHLLSDPGSQARGALVLTRMEQIRQLASS